MTTLRERRRLRLPPELVKTVHRRVSRRTPLSRDSVARALQRLVARATPLRWTTALGGGSHGVYRAVLRDRPVEIHVDPDDVDQDGVVVDVRLHTTPPIEEEVTSGTFQLDWKWSGTLAGAIDHPGLPKSGLYVLERYGRPVYVGQSATVRQRLREHAASFRRVLGRDLPGVRVSAAAVRRIGAPPAPPPRAAQNGAAAAPEPAKQARRQLADDLQTVEWVVIRYLLGKKREPVEKPGVRYLARPLDLNNAESVNRLQAKAGPIEVRLGMPPSYFGPHRTLTIASGEHYET
jgi:hypothetical protein